MRKYSRCLIGISDNDMMRYPELHKKHSNVYGNFIIHTLAEDGDGAVRATWINAKWKGGKQVLQESLHTFVTTSLLG